MFQLSNKGSATRYELAISGDLDIDATPDLIELGGTALADSNTQTLVSGLNRIFDQP